LSFWHIKRATLTVQSEGIIAYPTEAVYGLGCSPWNAQAVARILTLKRRSPEKGLIIVASHIEQLESLVDFSADIPFNAIQTSWPGPVTWVLPARMSVPTWIRGSQEGIAVRVSAHPLVRELCEAAGLLVSTSANPEGYRPAVSAFQVRSYFHNNIDFIVPGHTESGSRPTEIRHALSGKILRRGN